MCPGASLSPLSFFSFNDTATPEIYTLSLHDALPISDLRPEEKPGRDGKDCRETSGSRPRSYPAPASRSASTDSRDRKSTRLNSSHMSISYAVFCLKKKKKKKKNRKTKHNEYSHDQRT